MLTDEVRAEHDKRLKEYHQNPSVGYPWNAAKERIIRGE